MSRPATITELSREDRARIMESFFQETCAILHDSSAEHRAERAAARRFLRQRGFSLEDLPQVPLGLMIDASAMRRRLADAGFSRDEIEASHLAADDRLAGRLIGPIRDAQGRIVNFWARHTGKLVGSETQPTGKLVGSETQPTGRGGAEPQPAEGPAYLFLTGNWKQQVVAFGLDVACREPDRPLVLVEGIFDALLLQALGLHQVAAVGGRIAELTRQRWQRLGGLEMGQSVLAPTRREGVEPELAAAAEMSLSATAAPEVWVLPPDALGEAGSLADYAVRNGVEAARALLKRGAIHGLRFLALELLARHRSGKRWTKRGREAALEEANHIYDDHLADHEVALLEHFVPPIVEALRLKSFPVVEEEPEPEPEPAVEPPAEESFPSPVAGEGGERSEPGEGGLNCDLAPTEQADLPFPAPAKEDARRTVADELPDHQRWLERHQGLDLAGLPQRTLRTLDQAIQGLRGLMLLAGPPGAGKSALGLQWGLDVVRHNPEACFLFVSLEMPRRQLVTRLLCRLARVPWKRLVLGGPGVLEGDSYTPAELRRLERAEEELRLWGRRMLVLDDQNCACPTLETVTEQLARLKADSGAERALVLVDHLQLWPAAEPDGLARMRAMQLLHHASPDDALLVLAETPAGQRIDPAQFGGVPDLLLALHPFGPPELTETIARFSRGDVRPGAWRIWQEELTRRGRTLDRLSILGGRDGVRRTELDLTFYYRYSTFREGIVVPPAGLTVERSPRVAPPLPAEADLAASAPETADSFLEVIPAVSPEPVPPAMPEPARPYPRRTGECELHRCGMYECFCFD